MRTRFSPFIPSILVLLSGCGGGGGLLSSGTGGGGAPVTRAEEGTAKFRVDVNSGKVDVIPLGGSRATRAVFAGSAISFNSTTLVDDAGGTGRKTISVSLQNNRGETIGQTPNGRNGGLRVMFGAITNTSTTNLKAYTNVSTIAGTGSAGTTDGSSSNAQINTPNGTTVDPATGAVYFTSQGDSRVRKVLSGFVSTVAGGGDDPVNGVGNRVLLMNPTGIAWNPVDGSLIVSEYSGQRIRRITPDGRASLIAGTGTIGSADGAGDVATLTYPTGVAIDSSGNIYVAESYRVRKISFTGTDRKAASSYTVASLAGNGAFGAVDGTGFSASFGGLSGIVFDSYSNALYATDSANNRIRRVSLTGDVSTIAGTFASGTTDGPGNTASFTVPKGIASIQGILFISDNAGQDIRMMRLVNNSAPASAASWRVMTIAGTGSTGGADGVGNVATFNKPNLISSDQSGNIYVADQLSNKIRLVVAPNGFNSLGNGTSGSSTDIPVLSNADGVVPDANQSLGGAYITYPGALTSGASTPAKSWGFVVPNGVTNFEFSVTVEAVTSTLAQTDSVSNAGPTGAGSPNVLVSTVAGVTGVSGSVDGSGTIARFDNPMGVAVDQHGVTYVACYGSHTIKRIGTDGNVTTIIGYSGNAGSLDGTGNLSTLNGPNQIITNAAGTVLYSTDYLGNRIRRIVLTGSDPSDSASWTVSTIVGSAGIGLVNGSGIDAKIYSPAGIVQVGNSLFVTENKGHRIRRLTYTGGDPNNGANWQVTVYSGDGSILVPLGAYNDGSIAAARFSSPWQITADRTGTLYVADRGNNRIRKLTAGGVSSFAGSSAGYSDNAVGTSANFNDPRGITVDSAGYLYVADANYVIRKISPTGAVTTIAGSTTSGSLDGTGAVAQFNQLMSLAVTSDGTIYTADQNNANIRKISRIIGTH